MFDELTEFLDSFLEMGIPYYDCIVNLHGETVYRHSNGFLDPQKTMRVTGKERTNFYSCSKPITCIAAMQLWEKGLFKLNDKISDYLPEFKEMTVKTENGIKKCEKPILIENLFTMTGGFTYAVSENFLNSLKEETNGLAPTRDAIRILAREPLAFEPGEQWKYSCCHDIIACLVEVLSGMRFGEYVKKNIFDVLGMSHSTFSLPPEELDTIAPQYDFDYKNKKAFQVSNKIISVYNLGSLYESGGAGLISTVDDYIKFLEALRTGESLIKRDTLNLMIHDRLGKEKAYSQYYGYGLGMRCPYEQGENRDFGWGGKAGQFLAVDLENDFTVFYSQHIINPPNHLIKGRVYNYALEGIKKL